MASNLWKPAAYQGGARNRHYFEGWYFKLVSSDLAARWAFIPGISKEDDPDKTHAFIQVLDGMTGKSSYHRYPVEDFDASHELLDIRIGPNHFSSDGILLDIQDQDRVIKGEVGFSSAKPWPVRLLSPGAMGPYAFTPFMQCYHGIISFDHELTGSLTINDNKTKFSGGRGYIEKDWGRGFPRGYIWMQTNNFSQSGASLSASIATIPWLGSWFPGFIVGVMHDGEIIRFTPYLGSKTTSLAISDDKVRWELIRGRGEARSAGSYTLSIIAHRSEGGSLASPVRGEMTGRIVESMTSVIDVELTVIEGGVEKVLFSDRGEAAGLEVAGEVAELIEGLV